MKKLSSKLLAMIVCVGVLCESVVAVNSLAPNATVILENENTSTDSALIQEFFSALDSKNYTQLINCCGDIYQQDLSELLSNPTNYTNHVGIINVDGINEVVILGEVSQAKYALNLELLSLESVNLYLVRFSAAVYEEGPFFYEGTNYAILVCSSQNKNRMIVGFITPSMETICDLEYNLSCANEFAEAKFGVPIGAEEMQGNCCWCYYEFSNMPAEIIVKQTIYNKGNIIPVNFKEFCKVATANEFCYDSYPTEYLRAGALCVRNYAWYFYIQNRYSSLGYHITDDSSTHLSYHPADTPLSSIPNTSSAVDYIWNIRMENSDGNLFASWFHKTRGTKNSGRVSQTLAKSLAEEGRNFSEILHYLYDYSDRSTGAIIIACNGSHDRSTTQPYSHTTHGPACNKCHTPTGSATEHTFRDYTTYYKCTACGYITTNPSTISGLPGNEIIV